MHDLCSSHHHLHFIFRHWNSSLEFDDADQSEFQSLLDNLLDPSSSSYLSQSGTSAGGLSLSDRISTGMQGSGSGFGGSLESRLSAMSTSNLYSANKNGNMFGAKGSGQGINGSFFSAGSGMNGDGSNTHGAGSNIHGAGSNIHGAGSNMYGAGSQTNGSGQNRNGDGFIVDEQITATTINGVNTSSPSSRGSGPHSDSGFGSQHSVVTTSSYHSGANVLDGLDGGEVTEVMECVTTTGVESSMTSSSYGTANVSQVT